MRHTYREVDACGVKVALKLLAGKWTPIIFYHLRAGSLRFLEPRSVWVPARCDKQDGAT